MNYFGKRMAKNINYDVVKEKVNDYIRKMDAQCEACKQELNNYYNAFNDGENYGCFDEENTLKFIRTWDIIKNEIPIPQRNLLIAYQIAGNRLEPCLQYFNGEGEGIKNKSSLAVLISNARKAVRYRYYEKYDFN